MSKTHNRSQQIIKVKRGDVYIHQNGCSEQGGSEGGDGLWFTVVITLVVVALLLLDRIIPQMIALVQAFTDFLVSQPWLMPLATFVLGVILASLYWRPTKEGEDFF